MQEQIPESLRAAIFSLRADDTDSACGQLDELLQERPGHELAQALQARIARQSGDIEAAARWLEMVQDRPDSHPQVLAERGYLALEQGAGELAVDYFERLAVALPAFAAGHFNLARAYRAAGRQEAALLALDSALEHRADEVHEVHSQRGALLLQLGREQDAEQAFLAALEHRGGDAVALLGLAQVVGARGELMRSESLCRQALSHQSDLYAAWQHLADAKSFHDLDDPDLVAMDGLLTDPAATDSGREALHFALGKALDDCCEYDLAFDHYAQARNLQQEHTPPYDRAGLENLVDQTLSVFSASLLRDGAEGGSSSQQPLLLAGMPRAGVGLVETLLAAHSEVTAGGELGLVDRLRGTSLDPWPDAARELEQLQLEQLAERVLENVTAVAPSGLVCDSHPANHFNVGLFALLFPRAPIILCHREPISNCLALFFRNTTGLHNFATSLDNIGHYYMLCHTLLEHWREVLGERLISIEYEQLIREPEAALAPVCEQLGFELRPELLAGGERRTEPGVPRVLREPVLEHSLQRAEHYAPYIGVLREALGLADDS